MKRLLAVLLFALVAVSPRAEAACTSTINLGLQICDTGDPDWDVFTNANWNKVDLSFASPLSRTGTAVSLGTVPYSKGGTGQTSYTKGDLLVGTASGLVKLAVGNNGMGLVADSSQTSGLKWAFKNGPPFSSDLTLLYDNADLTKLAKFDLSDIDAATTRTYALQNRNGTLADLGPNNFGDDQTINGDLSLLDQHSLLLFEDGSNGSNKIAIVAPNSLSADVTYTLPSDDGDADDVLTTDGSGNLAWAPGGGGGGGGTQFAGGSAGSNLSNSAVNYFSMQGNAAPSASNCNAFRVLNTDAYTSIETRCQLDQNLTGGMSYTIEVYGVGVGPIGTPCTIDSVSVNSCVNVDATASGSWVELCYRATPTGTPTAASITCATKIVP